MKKLFKNFPMALVTLALLVSCGKANSSGSGGSNDGLTNSIGSDGFSVGNQNYNDLNAARSVFNAKSLADGLVVGSSDPASSTYYDGTEIYRTGEFYDNKSVKVVSANSSSVELRDQNNSTSTFNRESAQYKKMLGLTGDQMIQSQVRQATISVSGQNVPAKYIEIAYDGYIMGYLVTTNLPVVANPILVTKTTIKESSFLGFIDYTSTSTKTLGTVYQVGSNQINSYQIQPSIQN